MPDDILFSTLFPSQDEKVKVLGVIYSASCLSRSMPYDMAASLRNMTIGGEIETYSNMMIDGMNTVLARLHEEAKKIGADAVYGLRLTTPNITGGAAELIAYGTAVKRLPKESTNTSE